MATSVLERLGGLTRRGLGSIGSSARFVGDTAGGALGLLLNDPSMYRHADSLLVELRRLTADVQANPKKYVSIRVF